MSFINSNRIALVLGGGGLKGFAHLGALKAMEECGIEPTVVAGTSIGSLMAAAYAAGTPIDDLINRARVFRKRELFRLNHIGMVVDRMRNPAIYLEQPLRNLVNEIVPDVHFDDLPRRLLVNTLDISTATQVVWGLKGLQHVSVRDAVYASCALPGFFPPGIVGDRVCIDGGVVDNLPVSVASLNMDAVIAIDVGSTQIRSHVDIEGLGFAAIYMRAATTMMHELQIQPLAQWQGVPMLLIQPPVSHVDWFDASQTDSLIELGYNAAKESFALIEDGKLSAATGIFPRREVALSVSEERCIGCGLCAALAPQTMGMAGIAFPRQPVVTWSPADGDFVRQCPTNAISAVDVTSELTLQATRDTNGDSGNGALIPPTEQPERVRRKVRNHPASTAPLPEEIIMRKIREST